MGKMATDRSQSTLVDDVLRDEMARSNRALRSLAPVVSHLLESDGPSLVSDAIVARLRGMLSHIAFQLVEHFWGGRDTGGRLSAAKARLNDQLLSDGPLVDHLYSLALESFLAQSLAARSGIDPVLSPLLQELIASDKPEIAEIGMKVLAAQSRFTQSQARMELPLSELPHELLLSVIAHIKAGDTEQTQTQIADAGNRLKQGIDEADSRIALLSRLATSMQGGAVAALNLNHSGLALFISSAASLTRQDRERIVFACHEGQAVRLALTLKAAGMNGPAIGRQIALLGGQTGLPQGIETMAQSHAIDALREMSAV